ncbi:hypothetical protein M5689_021316 [Euphorbia peplus]|nr:hypothetical protein M5689_021316 [Euphorbia peplus]
MVLVLHKKLEQQLAIMMSFLQAQREVTICEQICFHVCFAALPYLTSFSGSRNGVLRPLQFWVHSKLCGLAETRHCQMLCFGPNVIMWPDKAHYAVRLDHSMEINPINATGFDSFFL